MKILDLKDGIIYECNTMKHNKYVKKDGKLYFYNIMQKSFQECDESWNYINDIEFNKYEYIYNTADVLKLLKIDSSKMFEYPVPNHIGMIRIKVTNEDICFDNEGHINKFKESKGNLNMIWKEITI